MMIPDRLAEHFAKEIYDIYSQLEDENDDEYCRMHKTVKNIQSHWHLMYVIGANISQSRLEIEIVNNYWMNNGTDICSVCNEHSEMETKIRNMWNKDNNVPLTEKCIYDYLISLEIKLCLECKEYIVVNGIYCSLCSEKLMKDYVELNTKYQPGGDGAIQAETEFYDK